jgi:hypothetical protein
MIPNPAAAAAALIYDATNTTTNAVELYDYTGRMVYAKQDPYGTSGKIDIDLTDLSNGIYMARYISDGKLIFTSKLVVAQ